MDIAFKKSFLKSIKKLKDKSLKDDILKLSIQPKKLKPWMKFLTLKS